MSLEALASAGLYDPAAPNAAERREYLEYLLERFSVEDILSVDLTHWPIVDVLAVLSGGRSAYLSAREVAARTGMSPEEIADLRALASLPVASLDSAEIHENFANDVLLYQFGVAAYGEERTRAFVRVVGGLASLLTEAGRELVWAPTRDAAMTELEIAIANHEATLAGPQVVELLGHLFAEHGARDMWFEEEIRRGGVSMAIAFVDLVGSTNWTAALSEDRHAAALNRFEDMAVRAANRNGSRVVKFIGDEAMIAGRQPAAVTTAVAELRSAIAGDEVLPAARATVGYGPVTPRGGDYFGDTVNLVGRAAKETAGDVFVVTSDVAAALDATEWIIGTPRAITLRGVATPLEVLDVERKVR